MSTSYAVFLAVTPGLEPALAAEIAEISPGAKIRSSRGGVEVRGSRELLWTLAAESRLAETVRVRVGRFKAHNFAELESGLARIPWAAYLARDAPVTLQVTARKSALYHSGAIADRMARILDRPLTSPDGDGVRLWVRLVHDAATVSIDAGGGLLHRRGWRKAVGRAPLRETLAAAAVRLAQLAPEQAMWDPFCGSGTLPLEAALVASGRPAQGERRFGFLGWPTHDAEGYQAWRAGRPAPVGFTRPVFGSDHIGGAIADSTANAKRAGCDAQCTWLSGDFEAHLDAIPQGAAVVTNTPYGKRLAGGPGLERLFARFGEVMARRPDLGPVVALVGSRGFESATGLAWTGVAEFSNRGTPTRLLALER